MEVKEGVCSDFGFYCVMVRVEVNLDLSWSCWHCAGSITHCGLGAQGGVYPDLLKLNSLDLGGIDRPNRKYSINLQFIYHF